MRSSSSRFTLGLWGEYHISFLQPGPPLLYLGITKLGYKCHEKRLSGKMSMLLLPSLNQTQQETSAPQGHFNAFRFPVPTGIKVVKQLPSKLSKILVEPCTVLSTINRWSWEDWVMRMSGRRKGMFFPWMYPRVKARWQGLWMSDTPSSSYVRVRPPHLYCCCVVA